MIKGGRRGERRVTCALKNSALEKALLSSSISPSSTSPFFSSRSATDPDDGLYRPATIPSSVLLPHPDLECEGVVRGSWTGLGGILESTVFYTCLIVMYIYAY
jgi:hypothetical protein